MRIENKKFSIITSENFNSYVLMKKENHLFLKQKPVLKNLRFFQILILEIIKKWFMIKY